ncbi:JAB domain-containing protein [Dysgonomonas sp.]|uniref:JAB domain-containing protein n=1 Tax=Dysgonomonas sp. TaxID=1891233 RepID=UPI002D1FB948|nr:JAB domain-containing protein [Dysgonomonas sp.]
MKHFDKSDMEKKESFKMLLLNEENELIKVSDISEGDEIFCNIDAKKMFEEIFANNANAIIICHNHCSKNLTPSHNDNIQTKHIQSVCDFFDIRFLGHLIINLGGYYFMYPYSEE